MSAIARPVEFVEKVPDGEAPVECPLKLVKTSAEVRERRNQELTLSLRQKEYKVHEMLFSPYLETFTSHWPDTFLPLKLSSFVPVICGL